MPETLPTTDLDIVNLALSNLGHTVKVVNLSTDTTVEAITARQWIDLERRNALGAHRWRWAEVRAVLVELTGTGAWWDAIGEDWAHVYTRPTDLLWAREIWPGTRAPGPEDAIPFEEVVNSAGTGRVLVTDEPPVVGSSPLLLYTPLATAVAMYAAHFSDFLAWSMSVRLAMPLKQDKELLRFALAGKAQAFVNAVRLDAQWKQRDPGQPLSPSLRARGATRRFGQLR